MLDESLHKLNKCWEALNSKKQLRNEILPNERPGRSQFSKMVSQTHRSPSELVNQRLEDRPERPKNVTLNKRISTSVVEGEGQSNSFVRQPLAIGKDRENIKDGGKGCDIVEEKIRRLPAGGETWDRKVKRKRSMSTVSARSIDGEGELKRVMHLKLANESGLQSSDAQGLRSGYSGSNSKLDVASMPACSNGCVTTKKEQEKVSRDSMNGSNKDKVVLIGNKLSVRDNNYANGICSLAKGKAPRAPRTGPLTAGNLSSVSHSSETLEAWKQPSNVNKPHSVSGTINHKLPFPAAASSSQMAQWVGQRPQKISRSRRANVVSPVLSCDEVQMALEGCSPSVVGTRLTSSTAGGSLISKCVVNSTQLGRVKHENISSPTKLSESEGSGAVVNGEIKLKEKRLGGYEVDEREINNSYNINSSMLATKKKKMSDKKEIGNGLRKQGRKSRGSSVFKTGIASVNEKLEISTVTKPVRSMKPGSEKNGSKSGRLPLKKSCDRKAVTRLGHPSTCRSPDIAGELDDDREELLAAANFASNASYIGCSSSFWKKLEPNFSPVCLVDIAYLKRLVKSTEEDHKGLSQMLGFGSDALDGLVHKDKHLSQSRFSREREKSVQQTDSKVISSMVDVVDQHLDVSFLFRQVDTEAKKDAPLCQRILSALIIDNETDEETVGGGNMSSLCERDDSPGVTCFSQDIENQSKTRIEHEFKSGMFSCNGNPTFTSGANTHDQEPDFLQVRQGPLHPETERSAIISENGSGGLLSMHRISCSSFNHFEQMSMEDKLLLELQSVGIYPEPVPDPADRDCEAINHDIIQLQKALHQQVTKKREYFMKLNRAVEEGREMEQRALQQVAMDKLVELAYKKKLATRGSSAARNGIPKVSRSIASAFMKRTLARCRKFEETGRSCFLEPVFEDVLFAAPACDTYAGSVVAVNPPLTQNLQQESALPGLFPCRKQDALGSINHPSDQDFTRTGPILNRGKKKELLLDDVGANLRSATTLGNSFMGGAKGKRSGRGRDKGTSGRNSVTKGGGSSAYSRGERNTKAKPKQKAGAGQLSTARNGSLGKLMENDNSDHQLARGPNEVVSSDKNRKSIPIETEEPMDLTKLHELDSIELGIANELNGHQDLDAWLNIDEDGLQDDAVGLDIPMDDLSELNMIL